MRRMGRVFSLGILIGCGSEGAGDSVQELDVQHYEVVRLTTRFGVQEVEKELPARQAFLIRKACPKIRSARLEKEDGVSMALLKLEGEQLESIWGMVGRTLDGKFGVGPAKKSSDGTIRFGVQCSDCDLHFGMLVDEIKVACVGPGYSLKIRDGKLRHY